MTNSIPTDWKQVKANEICSLITNGFVGKATDFYTESEDGVIYIQGYNILENGFKFNGVKKVTRDFHKKNSKSNLREGDVLIIQTGDVGLTTIVPKSLAGSNCHALIINRFIQEKAFPQYMSQFYNSPVGRHLLKRIETGSTMKHLNVGDLKKLKIILPPLPEQHRIAAVLETWDKALETLTRKIELKKNIKKGLMQDLLTGKRRIKGFDEEWKTVKLGDICEIKTGKKDNQDKIENGEYPFFVRSPHIERIDSYSFDGEAILIPGEGNIGKIFHYINGKFDYHQRVYRVSDFQKKAIGKFIYFHFLQNFAKQANTHSVKATVDSLRLPTFQMYEINLPSKEEQTAIAHILTTANDEITTLEKKKQILEDQKKFLLNNLITGQIRTPENLTVRY